MAHFTSKDSMELKQFHAVFCGLHWMIAQIKRAAETACIQFSKIPPKISETLAVHIAPLLFPLAYDFKRGGGRADVTCFEWTQSGIELRRIEVKGTSAGFQSFSRKDCNAHYLIWFDFACYRTGRPNDLVTVYVLANPKRHGFKPGRITLKKFLAMAGCAVCVYQGLFSELADGKVKQVTPDGLRPQHAVAPVIIAAEGIVLRHDNDGGSDRNGSQSRHCPSAAALAGAAP